MGRKWVVEKCDDRSGWIRLTPEEMPGGETEFKSQIQAERAMKEAKPQGSMFRTWVLRTRQLSKNGN